MPPEVMLFGVSMTVIIPLAVQAFKIAGMPGRLAPWAALVLSGLAAGAGELLNAVPGSEPFIRAAVYALVLFLIVTGAYHVTKNVAENTVAKDRNLPGPGQ